MFTTKAHKTNKVNLSEQYAQSEFLPKAKSPPPSW